METEYSLMVKDLHHAYGCRRKVLNGVDLSVNRGSILALLGLNGAGKTTLIRSILGLVRPDTGVVELLGRPLNGKAAPSELLARLGYVPERPTLYERMTAKAVLEFVREVHPRWREGTVRRFLEIFHIPLERRCKDLSTGTKAQLALTIAMAGDPELLILDEPTLGLDPLHRHQYLQLLLAEATERDLTIMLTSHDLYQIERVADSVAILHGGRIAVQAPLDELKTSVKRIRVGTAESSSKLAAELAALPGVRKVQADLGGYLVATVDVSATLAADPQGIPGVSGIQVLDLSLEEIFLVYCEDGNS
ncbi:MAG: ABC transporter ATP-binding protein [Bacteroidota bacterium]